MVGRMLFFLENCRRALGWGIKGNLDSRRSEVVAASPRHTWIIEPDSTISRLYFAANSNYDK